MEIGAERLAGQTVLIADLPESLPVDLAIGMDHLEHRRIWLSYDRQRLHVQRVPLRRRSASPAG